MQHEEADPEQQQLPDDDAVADSDISILSIKKEFIDLTELSAAQESLETRKRKKKHRQRDEESLTEAPIIKQQPDEWENEDTAPLTVAPPFRDVERRRPVQQPGHLVRKDLQ